MLRCIAFWTISRRQVRKRTWLRSANTGCLISPPKLPTGFEIKLTFAYRQLLAFVLRVLSGKSRITSGRMRCSATNGAAVAGYADLCHSRNIGSGTYAQMTPVIERAPPGV